MLQGLAILMMLYHHLFITPEALFVPYKSVLDFISPMAEIKLAWFCKICVGIYAFISGYGLCRLLEQNDKSHMENHNFFMLLKDDYRVTISQLLKLYFQYWLVFVIFVPIGFLFFNWQFNIVELLLNFLGVISTYNGAWWYVFFYLKLMLIMPIMYRLFCYCRDKKYIISQIIFYGIIIVILCGLYVYSKEEFDRFKVFVEWPFLECAFVGVVISRFKLYELCHKHISEVALDVLGIIGMISCVALRIHMAKDALSVGLDFVLVPVICYGFCVIMNHSKKASKVFLFFGKYSTFMWLIHVFVYDKYMKSVVMLSKVSTGIYLTLVVLSLLLAMIVLIIYEKLRCLHS